MLSLCITDKGLGLHRQRLKADLDQSLNTDAIANIPPHTLKPHETHQAASEW